MSLANAPDLGKTPPRSGREMIGGYAFLARVADKVRAEHAGTNGDYIGYCPMSMGVLERMGLSKDDFDKVIREGASDAELVAFCDRHVSDDGKRKANDWVLNDMSEHLDRQDQEEGRA